MNEADFLKKVIARSNSSIFGSLTTTYPSQIWFRIDDKRVSDETAIAYAIGRIVQSLSKIGRLSDEVSDINPTDSLLVELIKRARHSNLIVD